MRPSYTTLADRCYNAVVNVILIGYRGSGKTTLGKKLADDLRKTFVDVDDEARKRFGSATIADIFDQHGEMQWRRVEVEVTAELVGRSDQVIGLGGGTLMQDGARQAVEQAADTIRIYLKCEPAALLQRIQGDTQSAASRPNLTKLGGGIDEIKGLLAERGPVYEAVADHVLDVTHLSPPDAVRYLVRQYL